MARVIFVNRYFFPDHSATSQILSDLAFYLVEAGNEVHVITSKQIYDDPAAALPDREVISGVNVHRVASTRFGRAALFGRALDYISFYHAVRQHLGRIARAGDIVVVKTDPPLLSVALAPIARHRRAHLVNWLQDIYPETAKILGVPLLRGPIAAAFATSRNRSLQDADANVVVGELMARRLQSFGVAAARVHVIANWCNDETIRPIPAGSNPLREKWQLTGKFVVGYSGNLGRAHDYETVLRAAQQLRSEPDIIFLMIGAGRNFERLARAVRVSGLENVFRFQPYQQRDTLPASLGVPDVHWLSLKPELEGLIVPSKFYGIAAAGKPMIMIGDEQGEIARLIRQHRCGIVIAPGAGGVLAETLRRWSKEPEVIQDNGMRARQMLETKFSKRASLARWNQLLNQLAQSAVSTSPEL